MISYLNKFLSYALNNGFHFGSFKGISRKSCKRLKVLLVSNIFTIKLITVTKTLRYLDLESNNLTNDTEENGGVEEMI